MIAAARHPWWNLAAHVDGLRARMVKDNRALIAERDRYQQALERIRDRDWMENALDPQWAAGVATQALDPDWTMMSYG